MRSIGGRVCAAVGRGETKSAERRAMDGRIEGEGEARAATTGGGGGGGGRGREPRAGRDDQERTVSVVM